MSLQHYFAIHELLAQLPSWRAGTVIPSPPHRQLPRIGRLPRVGQNGIYFMYEDGEVFEHNLETHERIVSIGINETEGRLESRLKDYGRDRGTPLHGYVHEALALKRSVKWEQVSDLEVTAFIRRNFRYRFIRLPSAADAKLWGKRVIPTIARYSQPFVSKVWLGRGANLLSGIWNVEYTTWFQEEFDDNAVQKFAVLVNASVG